MMKLWTTLVCFLYAFRIVEVARTAPFYLSRVEWSLSYARNSLKADVVLSDGSNVYATWLRRVTGEQPDGNYWIPLNYGLGTVEIEQHNYIGQGGRHLEHVLIYGHAPQELLHKISIGSSDGAVWYEGIVNMVPSGGRKQPHVLTIDGLRAIDYPDLVQHFQEGQNSLALTYQVNLPAGSTKPSVVVRKNSVVPASAAEGIFTEETIYDSESSDTVSTVTFDCSVPTDSSPSSKQQCTLILNFSDLKATDEARYYVIFTTADESLRLTTDLIRNGRISIFPHGTMFVQLSSCNPASQTQSSPGSNAGFTVQSNSENCVTCTAGGDPLPEVRLYSGGYLLGTGDGLSVYSFRPARNIVKGVMVFEYLRSGGQFSCKATNSMGKSTVATFTIGASKKRQALFVQNGEDNLQ